MLAGLPAAALLAWTLPEAWWDGVAAAHAALSIGLPGAKIARDRQQIAAFVRGDALDTARDDLLRRYARNVRLAELQYLRCHRPRGWRPQLGLQGGEHLDRALAAGRGAIIWVAPFVFAPLVTKMLLHATGYGLVHLSRSEHGGSPTRLGLRLLNPVRVRVENRHLAERIVIGADSLREVATTLTHRLAANRVVSITATAWGVKTCTAPFLHGALHVATGAPGLALRTGAPLLPAITVREAPGRFVTIIEPPIDLAEAGDRERTLQAAVAGLVHRIEHHARRWPDQFHWHQDITGRHRSGERD